MSAAQELQFICDLAREAGRVAMSHFGKVERLTKTNSASKDESVSEADRATQRTIVSALKRRFPNDGIVGEENETGDAITFECPDPMGRVWVIDPIDGTNNFLAGFPCFGVCIGLLEGGMATMGVVYDVTRDQVYAAAKGQGAWLGNRRIEAPATPISDASLLMLTSNLLDKNGRCPKWACNLISQTDWKTRILGSAALEAVHVASGVAHAAITVNGKLWDCAAPAAIVLEAGGKVTDLKGRDIFPFNLREYQGAKVPFLAAGAAAHGEVLREILKNP
ncbi:MAG TPA: inositol monophosphatase [Tepidisphaeraceae bacterium]|nr:inositol monophosphatase [Tepidisphaeraceae bacterium]